MNMWHKVAVWMMLGAVACWGQDAGTGEAVVTGSLEAAHRWVTDIAGSGQTYRSVVNLGEGPKLLDFNLFAQPKERAWMDRLLVSGGSWGGDPYNHARLELERYSSYRLSVDYRNLSYFNFLPSFANPAFGAGLETSQRTFDLDRRLAGIELELWPGRRMSPYVGYRRDSGKGYGITPFVENGNEYPLRTRLFDKTDEYRAGVQGSWRRWSLTLEQGGTAFKDDQGVFSTEPLTGNRAWPLLGQQLRLDSLTEGYRVRGRSLFSRIAFVASPVSWLDVSGRFLFSQPRTEVGHRFDAQGLLYYGLTRFLTARESLFSGEAKQPHTTGSLTAELRPLGWLRLRESWSTNRFHNASSSLLSETLLEAALTSRLELLSADRLIYNYNRQQVEVFVAPVRWWTVRAGHRYEWGDAQVRAPSLSLTGLPGQGQLRRHVGLLGLSFRSGAGLRATLDYEGAATEKSYFRTSLHDYQKVRVQGQWSARPSFRIAGQFRFLDNEKRAETLVPAVAYDQRFLASTLSLEWRPWGSQQITVLGDYTRYALRASMLLATPGTLAPATYLHRENAHLASSWIEVRFPTGSQVITPELQLGGSLYRDAGSRPARFYQPFLRFLVPVHARVAAFGEWRYYGLGQAFYELESFRVHHLLAGLRLTL